MEKNVSGRENCSLSVRFALNVGTGVLDGPSPFDQESLSGQGYLRTVEDAGPYGFIFKHPDKPKSKIPRTTKTPWSRKPSTKGKSVMLLRYRARITCS